MGWLPSGERLSNAWVTCPLVGDSLGKPGVIPHVVACRMAGEERRGFGNVARGGARVLSACWWGNGPPRR